MQIEQNNFVAKIGNVRNLKHTAKPVLDGTLVSFEASEQLNQTVTSTPDVRAEMVARGKALIANPNYPSKEQVKAIAGMLAENWNSPKALTNRSAAGVRDAAIITAVG